jgi:biotin transport system substrate-specific component
MTVRVDRMHASLITTLAARSELAYAIRAAAVVFIAALTAAAAQLSIPLPGTPVPFTLQPIVVLVGGAALGSRLGMTSQVVYLLAGIMGLPVFAASPVLPQGVARLVGPTGGYLMSYPVAAFVTGWLAERHFDRRYFTSVLAMTAGLAVIFAGGLAWFAWFAQPVHNGLADAFQRAVYPFVILDILKIFIAASAMPLFWRFARYA